jgi:hypothetical protein
VAGGGPSVVVKGIWVAGMGDWVGVALGKRDEVGLFFWENNEQLVFGLDRC